MPEGMTCDRSKPSGSLDGKVIRRTLCSGRRIYPPILS